MPKDGYEVQIEAFAPCHAQEALHFKMCRRQGTSGLERIAHSALFVGHWGGSAKGILVRREDDEALPDIETDELPSSEVSADAQLGLWGIEADAEQLPVISVPTPVAFLVEHHAWRWLLLLVRWHAVYNVRWMRQPPGPLLGWPPSDSKCVERVSQNEVVDWDRDNPDHLALTADSLLIISDRMRVLGDLLVNRGAVVPPDAVAQLETIVSTFDRWAFTWKQSMGMMRLPGGGGGSATARESWCNQSG